MEEQKSGYEKMQQAIAEQEAKESFLFSMVTVLMFQVFGKEESKVSIDNWRKSADQFNYERAEPITQKNAAAHAVRLEAVGRIANLAKLSLDKVAEALKRGQEQQPAAPGPDVVRTGRTGNEPGAQGSDGATGAAGKDNPLGGASGDNAGHTWNASIPGPSH